MSNRTQSLSSVSFTQVQQQFSDYLRDPETRIPPANIEDRRLGIYRDLIFNNIEGFLAGGFPVLKSLYSEDSWRQLVRLFIVRHQAETPYFSEIGQEFLLYLQEEHEPRQDDPAFMLELAHYEWVELALDISPEQLPESSVTEQGKQESALTDDVLYITACELSPLLWRLSYQYPVHRLSVDNQLNEPPTEPTFLLVYRNREHEVQFIESNAVTHLLLNLLEEGQCIGDALRHIAEQLQHPNPESVLEMGLDIVQNLLQREVLFLARTE